MKKVVYVQVVFQKPGPSSIEIRKEVSNVFLHLEKEKQLEFTGCNWRPLIENIPSVSDFNMVTMKFFVWLNSLGADTDSLDIFNFSVYSNHSKFDKIQITYACNK